MEESKNLREVDIYVDGSFDGSCAKWAYIVVDNGQNIFSDAGIIKDPEINSGRQIGGECQAVIAALIHCVTRSYKANIYYDYIGLYHWISDAVDGAKPWRVNREYTQRYRQFCLDNKQFIGKMIKVKSHSGNLYNEAVDKLAAKAK